MGEPSGVHNPLFYGLEQLLELSAHEPLRESLVARLCSAVDLGLEGRKIWVYL